MITDIDPEIFDGILDDYTIEMETLSDTFPKAIAQYDYPYADGVDLEDMGESGHTMQIRCYFYDNDLQQTYADHIDLINDLINKELIDFMHPKYGLMQVKILSLVINHDDKKRTATVDFSLVEQMSASPAPTPNTSVLSSGEEAYIDGQADQEAKLSSDIQNNLPTPDGGVVSQILDPTQSLLAQVQGYSNVTRAWVGNVEKYLNIAQALVNQVVSPINSLQATISYSLNLPGIILGALSGALEKVALLYTSLTNYPTQYISKLDDAFNALQDSFDAFGNDPVMNNHLAIACAQRMALELAQCDDADQAAAADPTDSDAQVMGMDDLQNTLATARTRIENAVTMAREMNSLKNMALNLLNYVNSVRVTRQSMIAVTLDNPMPLHIVCLKYGLPYAAAETLSKINHIQQPNFTSGKVMVYVGPG